MNEWSVNQARGITQEEQQLYDHFLMCAQTESPGQLIDRFRVLFIEGTDYEFPIQTALDRLILSPTAEQNFRFVLNRCCHILINRWQLRPQHYAAIAELLALFETSPITIRAGVSRANRVKRLRLLVQQFCHTEQYRTLKRLVNVVHRVATTPDVAQPLGSLIYRYPYLYEHCLVSEGTPETHQASIRQLRRDRQRQFELDLSQYVTHQVRQRLITPENRRVQFVQNPTLLDDRALGFALQQFVGKVEGLTCRDEAQQFSNHCQQTRTYREFKRDLYYYLTASIDPHYTKRHFNRQLSECLEEILPDYEARSLSDFLIVRTCSQLLNFLVVDRLQHFVFVDLLANLGATLTTRLLLKIALFCRRVQPHLEKRFSILFHHYEGHSHDQVQWLVAAMENLQVALSANFSTLDLCFVNQLDVSHPGMKVVGPKC